MICRVLAVLVGVVAALIGYAALDQNPVGAWYRVSTSLRALLALYFLPQDHVEKFLGAYELFDQEHVTGLKNYSSNIINYYQVLNHLCAMGQVEKMYIPPLVDAKLGIYGNQMLWEETGMADKLDIGPNASVLDMGCGRGRIAHHVATHTGAKVTGLNIDAAQISMAEEFANATGLLGRQLDFVRGNYNDPFPFADATFDALYQVQVMTYTVDPVKLCTEMFRVLKPGAKVSFLDYVQLAKYDAQDPRHLDLLGKVKPVLGTVWTPKPEDFTSALEQSGFKVLFSGDASKGGHQYPLIEEAVAFFVPLEYLLTALTKVHLLPVHFKTLFDRLNKHGKAFIDADKLGLFTTSWQVIAQKPPAGR